MALQEMAVLNGFNDNMPKMQCNVKQTIRNKLKQQKAKMVVTQDDSTVKNCLKPKLGCKQ